MNSLDFMEVEGKVKSIITQYSNIENKENINIDDDFSVFGINSVDYIKIIVGIESEFDFEFDDDDLVLNRFNTIHELIDYVILRIGENNK